MYGVISGFQKLGEKIKNRYFDGEPDPTISQQKSIIKDLNPVALRSKASKILEK